MAWRGEARDPLNTSWCRGVKQTQNAKGDAMHYAGHIRQAFCDWVEAGMPATAVIERSYQEHEIPAEELLGLMWHCSDVLPGHICACLGIDRGSSYAAAAQRLRAERRRSA